MDVLPKTMQTLREEMRSSRGNELTVPQFRVLAAINRGMGFNKQIGELLGVSEAAISRMIDGLVKDGYIQKTVSLKDRRKSVLSLSAYGRKFFKSAKNNTRLHLIEKLEHLNSSDVQIILNGLVALETILS